MFFDVLIRVFTSADLWAATLQYGALLLLPALGGLVSERSGVTNIAMEGMMLVGAYAGVMTALATQNVLLGIAGAIICGGLIALVHAIVSINFKANQVVSGIAINIAALGLTNYLLPLQTGGQGVPSLAAALRIVSLPGLAQVPVIGPVLAPMLNGLAQIPFIGPVFFQQNLMFYIALILLVGMQFLLFRTNIGLRIRAVGEHPEAADTAGVNVQLVRYWSVIASGGLAGLGGAFLALGISGIFIANMTAGAGFIALAAVIFGKYSPWGVAGACAIFGLGQALSVRLQDTGFDPYLLSTVPYILTLVALVGLVGRTVAPAANGIPYEPGSE